MNASKSPTRRRVDLSALLSGLLFVGLGVLFALDASDRIRLDVSWVGPLVLIVTGTGWMVSGSRRQQVRSE